MPRNGAGVFNLAQPAFQAQTPISSSAVNSDLSDIADGLTGSLPRDGQGAMTAVLPLASTGFTYAADPNTGMSRSAADEQVITCGGTAVARFSTTGVDFTGSVKQDGVVILAPGIEAFTAAATAPNGWLIRNGAAVSRITYADLFTAIGTTYGSGDGSTTFNVPDARGRVDAGIDGGTGRLTGFNLAVAGGAQSVGLTIAQLPSVTGSISGDPATINVTSTSNAFVFGGLQTTGLNNGIFNIQHLNGSAANAVVTSTGSYTPTGTFSFGSNGAHPNIQPTIASTPIIKT